MSSMALRGLVRAFRGVCEASSSGQGLRSVCTSTFAHAESGQSTYNNQGPAFPQDEHMVLPVVERVEFDQYNSFSVVGNVAGAPTFRMDRSGRGVVNLTVVRNRRKRTSDGNYEEFPAEYFKFLCVGPLAHAVVREVRRGQRVLVNSFVRSKDVPVDTTTTTTNARYDSMEPVPRFTQVYSFLARSVSLVQSRHQMNGPRDTAPPTEQP